MKIGILTFHNGLNHGAYLQVYATLSNLKAMGHEVVIINYVNPVHWYRQFIRPLYHYRRPIRFLDRYQKWRSFIKDRAEFSLTQYTRDNEKIKKLHFDTIVIGSDIVWNYKLFGYDDLFFGGGNADRIVAYAPSFGWVNYGEEISKEICDALTRFSAISVRDDNTKKIVESCIGQTVDKVLDPTLIYDFFEKRRVTERVESFGEYILVYGFADQNPAVVNAVKRFAAKKGCKLIAVGSRYHWCDKTIMDVGPLEWLGFYQNAAFVFTATFHGTIFAIKARKNFVVSMNDAVFHKITSLLDTVGLSDRILDGDNVEMLWERSIDYRMVEKRLNPHIGRSLDWLKCAVTGQEKGK